MVDLHSLHISEKRFVYLVQNAESFFFFFFLNSRKIFPTKEMHSVTIIILHACQKLATKIKAFQSAFEVKDKATNGTCRQVNLPT